MKKTALAALLLLPTLGWASPNAADYTIAVHLSSTRIIGVCVPTLGGPSCQYIEHLAVTIDGKKYELEHEQKAANLVQLGDYKAKIVEDDKDHPFEFHREYEFLFQDGTKRKFLVVAEEE